jgi:MFS family permease
MTVARRFNETIQLATISFAALYATAALIGVLSLNQQILLMLMAFLGFVLSLLLLMWLLARYAQHVFHRLGCDEHALTQARKRIWLFSLVLGVCSIVLAWIIGFRHLV